jgi:hypothetical protein
MTRIAHPNHHGFTLSTDHHSQSGYLLQTVLRPGCLADVLHVPPVRITDPGIKRLEQAGAAVLCEGALRPPCRTRHNSGNGKLMGRLSSSLMH